MIQRKQTLFIIIALVLNLICLCLPLASFITEGVGVPSQMFNLWILSDGGARVFTPWPLFVLLLLTMPIGIAAILLYKNRIMQARLCVLNILLLIAWYIAFAVISLGQQGSLHATMAVSIPAAFPAVSIILYIRARHGVMADEKLVRSMDRIR